MYTSFLSISDNYKHGPNRIGVQFLRLDAIKKLNVLATYLFGSMKVVEFYHLVFALVYSDKFDAPGNLSPCNMASTYTHLRMVYIEQLLQCPFFPQLYNYYDYFKLLPYSSSRSSSASTRWTFVWCWPLYSSCSQLLVVCSDD